MLEFDNNRPVYIQILEYLKEKITIGEIKMGEKLPSVRELAGELKVNPNTIQRAYRDLETIEIINSKRGTGSYVTEEKEKIEQLRNDLANEIVSEFKRKMCNIGFKEPDMIRMFEEKGGK